MLGCLLCPAARAAASCVEVSPEVVTLRVESCESAESYRDRRLAKAALPWLVDVAMEVVARHPGVVLSGTIVDAQEFDWEDDGSVTLGAFRTTEEHGVWFLDRAAPERCDAWREAESPPAVRFVRHAPCCDVVPPYDVPCLFGVGLLVDVPPEVAERLE